MYDDDEIVQFIHKRFDQLRGRLAGFIEAVGLPTKQERGAIQTMKVLANDIEADVIELVLGDDFQADLDSRNDR